jgi:hypothetical protein
MRTALLCLAVLLSSAASAQVDPQNAVAKPFRVRTAAPGVIAIEIENPGSDTIGCVTGAEPELNLQESIGLERWTDNAWASALRVFESLRTFKVTLKPGERLTRLWREAWGEPGRYRATIDCGGTRFTPVEFDVPAGATLGVPSPNPSIAPTKPTDQKNVPAQRGTFAVTAMSLKAEPPAPGAPCPVTVKFAGQITTNGPGLVTYRFIRSDGATGSDQTLEFKTAATQSVATTWTLGGAGLTSYEGWLALRVLAPNEGESEQSAGRFTIACKG